MKSNQQFFALAVATGLLAANAWASGDHGAGGHSHDGGHGHAHSDPLVAFAKHHGVVLQKDGNLFEVTFSDQGVSVYPMTAEGQPLPTEGLHGTVLLKSRRRGRGRRIRLKLTPVPVEPGRLVAAGNLKSVKDESRSAILTIKGLPDGGDANLWTRFKRNSHGGESHDHGSDKHPHAAHDDDGHGHPHPAQPASAPKDDHGHSHGPGGHSH